ncbi:MAG: stage 0 sporulation family protein [bacterium]
MADVVGVVFHKGIKTYYFDPAGLELSRGDRVVVQTMKGTEIGQVVDPPHTVGDSEIPAPLKKVTRVATGKDLETQAAGEELRKEAMAACRELVASHGLDMKLVGADIGFGGEKITFSFYSEERVDFRDLVADLAKTLKMRIELRQVGAREEASMVGGLGPCGRDSCCTLFRGDENPVSIRMAKEQNLPLNPMKISGLCGRLMCCLKYEQDQYVRFRKEAPPKGTAVSTPAGDGVIVGYNVPKDAITVRFEDGAYTDIRLSGCQCREGGGLVMIPEVEEPPFAPVPEDFSGLEALAAAECTPEALPSVEAEVIVGKDGEAVEVILADGSRRGRSRRGRGRRSGKGRAQSQAPGEAAAGATDGAPGEPRSPGPGETGSGGQRRSQGPGRRPAGRSEQQTPGDRGPAGEGAGAGQSAGGGRARRRRRRRPGTGGESKPGSTEGSPGSGGGETGGGTGN